MWIAVLGKHNFVRRGKRLLKSASLVSKRKKWAVEFKDPTKAKENHKIRRYSLKSPYIKEPEHHTIIEEDSPEQKDKERPSNYSHLQR